MSRKTHDAVVTVGKYKDAQGNEKKRYKNVGCVFTDDQGRMSLKLDTIPCTPEWSGYISLFKVDGDQKEQRTPQPAPAPRHPPMPPLSSTEDDDDMPF